jgi:hypothetical protein
MNHITNLNNFPGKPVDFIVDGTVDFSISPWSDVIRVLASRTNTKCRKAVLEAGRPNTALQVNTTHVAEKFPSWEELDKRTSFGNAWVMASRAAPVQACENKCAKEGSINVFAQYIALPGHFASACADCVLQDWRQRCAHNRMHP